MNHLAHAWLAGDDPGLLVGSLLGDFWRGAPDPAWPAGVAAGVRLHRRIDSFTDTHPAVAAVRAQFEPPFRRYAGILLDVWYDHLLAQDFERLAGTALRPFADRVYTAVTPHDPRLPAPFRLFATRMVRYDLLSSYRDRERIDGVYLSLSERLTRANPIAHALPVMESLAGPLQRSFELLWRDLAGLRGRID
jgi:acyl carrier protein phosphodiesterase